VLLHCTMVRIKIIIIIIMDISCKCLTRGMFYCQEIGTDRDSRLSGAALQV